MQTCYIYGLFNPRELEFFYVGSSVNPHARFNNHMSGKGVSPMIKAVVDELTAEGLKPEMRILEEVSRAERRRYEGYWINYYRKVGHRLVNQRSVWAKGEPEMVNCGAAIYKHQLETIEEKANELGVPRAELLRNMLDFALKNMFK